MLVIYFRLELHSEAVLVMHLLELKVQVIY
nr:MAG TPA: hypothetical protein [Crassvirales sp.]DAT39563.1 MAG TPA: hypothetical protein [Caudoviricetes sp.]